MPMRSGTQALRAYRLVGGSAALVAVVWQLTREASVVDYLSYFTILSNLFAGVVLLYEGLRRNVARSTGAELVRGAAVVYMVTTGIVDNVMYGQAFAVLWIDVVVHRLFPLVVLLDWLLDPPHVPLTMRSTLLWLGFPLLYTIYTVIRGALVDWYPYYFFTTHQTGGYLAFAGSVAAIGAGILVLIALVTWAGNTRLTAVHALPNP